MTERRTYLRTAIGLEVTINDNRYQTRDISDSGMYVLAQGGMVPPLGAVVDVQVQGIIKAAPMLKMRVVRIDGEGFGLRLCREGDTEESTP